MCGSNCAEAVHRREKLLLAPSDVYSSSATARGSGFKPVKPTVKLVNEHGVRIVYCP